MDGSKLKFGFRNTIRLNFVKLKPICRCVSLPRGYDTSNGFDWAEFSDQNWTLWPQIYYRGPSLNKSPIITLIPIIVPTPFFISTPFPLPTLFPTALKAPISLQLSSASFSFLLFLKTFHFKSRQNVLYVSLSPLLYGMYIDVFLQPTP